MLKLFALSFALAGLTATVASADDKPTVKPSPTATATVLPAGGIKTTAPVKAEGAHDNRAMGGGVNDNRGTTSSEGANDRTAMGGGVTDTKAMGGGVNDTRAATGSLVKAEGANDLRGAAGTASTTATPPAGASSAQTQTNGVR